MKEPITVEIDGKDVVLGEATVRDKINGFTGVATGYAVYSHEDPAILVEAEATNDGCQQVSKWFALNRLEVA